MRSTPDNPTGPAMPAAVVVGGDLNGLGVCRSLAERGIRTYVVAPRRLGPAMWSRHAIPVRTTAHGGPQLLDTLHSLGKGLAAPPFLIIADELALATISASRKELREFRIRLPEHDIVTTLQNKALFHEFALANGLPVPRAVVIRNGADIARVRELHFPVVIKPADKRFVHEGAAPRLTVAPDASTAEQVSRELVDTVGEIIVQEHVGGPESGIYFSLFYCGTDRVPLVFTGRKLGNGPGMTSTVFCTGAAPNMAERLETLTRCFIERTAYAGFGSVEYKIDPQSGRFLIIEPTVGRTDWQEELATLCGVNLPVAAYCQEFGLRYQPRPRQDRVVWQASWVDRLRFGAPSVSAGVTRVDGYWRAGDPRPAIVHYPRDFIVSAGSIVAAVARRAAQRANRRLHRVGIRAPLRVASTGVVAMLCLGWPIGSQFKGTVPTTAGLVSAANDHADLFRPVEAPASPVAAASSASRFSPPEGTARIGETLEIGDKLKIVLYEHVHDVEQNKWARPSAPPLAFEERSEFTGDYTIGDDGMLSLPLLGAVQAAQSTEQQLEDELARAFKALTGQDAMVSIVSIARPGIYVLGPVKNPGSYAYMPGMTVLHAMALAGGFETSGNASWERVQAVQEYGKRSDAAEDLAALIARMAVLRAARDGGSAEPPAQLIDLVGDPKARGLIAKEEERRAPLEEVRRSEETALANSLQSAKQLAQTAAGTLGTMGDLIKMRTQRMDGLKSLAAIGNVSNLFLLQAQGELADAQQRQQDAAEKYAEAQQRVRQIEEDQAKLQAEEENTLASSIGTLEQQITVGEREIRSSNRILGALKLNDREPQLRQISAGVGGSSIEIIRRSPNGPVSLPANEMTLLRPGDLVRIVAPTQPVFDENGGGAFIKTQATDPVKTEAANPAAPAAGSHLDGRAERSPTDAGALVDRVQISSPAADPTR